MGRPPSTTGAPAFRFLPPEVAEMEARLQQLNNSIPTRGVLQTLADKFSASPERAGRVTIQPKQVWNWFQNRRYSHRAKTTRAAPSPPAKMTPSVADHHHHAANDSAFRATQAPQQEVWVRFSGFGAEEDEWINVRKCVRQCSLPCEATECVAVLPGDLILCFQEGKEQALYFDAHVLDAQRRRKLFH